MFQDTKIKITSRGRPYLGSPLGSLDFINEFITSKISLWTTAINNLSEVAKSSPHAAYAAYTHGLSSIWSFVCRTTPSICDLLQPSDDIIQNQLIPTLIGRPTPSNSQCSLFSLPTRMGGLNITLPSSLKNEHRWSIDLTTPLTSSIRDCTDTSYDTIQFAQEKAKKKIYLEREALLKSRYEQINPDFPDDLRFAVKLAQEKGASSWLNVLPIQEHGFSLHKSDFRDALALRYGWTPLDLPSHCSCGKNFTVDHALSCAKGGFPTLRHNEL